jgi:putative CRISPR-associated protein (TIGR02619 family)
MNFILTSCGLSLLTNYLKQFNIYPKEIYKYSNNSEKEINKDLREKVDKSLEKLKYDIINNNLSDEKAKELSAELNALLNFYKNGINTKDIHLLLFTDTYFGKKVAEIIKLFLEEKNLKAIDFLAKDLKTSNLEEFQFALSEIVVILSEELNGYKQFGYNIIFNLTGGFKSVNSFLQTMASLYADKSIYIFETSNELLEIPRLPIVIDEKFFEKNFEFLRKLEKNISIEKDILETLPKSIILKIENEYTLSPWGEIVYQKYKNEFFSKKLVTPITEKIQYSNEFKKDFEKLNPSEKYQLNKSIEKLENYILKGENLKSLRYHSLNGQISQKYTNEFYPFDGNDSRRVYCNEKNNQIILEKIDNHLK